jgi:TonB family protein
MRKLLYVAVAVLPLFSLAVELQISAQKRRGGPPASVNTNDQDAPPVRDDEARKKLFEECITPDRPKPEAEVRNSLLCGKAINLPKPSYPEEAKAQKVSGIVRINVVINEEGRVIWAEAAEGHPLLREASLRAACQSLYSPTKISGRAVKAGLEISYNFLSQ